MRLAEALSPAIRIEPELLRGVRLAMLPETDAGCEADLWFSDLVENRSPAGIVFDVKAATILRHRIAVDKERSTRAATIIARMHRGLPAAVRLEEEWIFLYLRGDADGQRERLRSAVASLVDPHRPGLATWAARAIERLPDHLHNLDEVQMLASGARLRVGEDAAPMIDVPQERLLEWINWLAPQDTERLYRHRAGRGWHRNRRDPRQQCAYDRGAGRAPHPA